ncbi:TPA: PIN domain-containing protein [archaeon]|nr:PIN domain-containing protein [Candidatus Naiadarchaeales archaeon SRR2090153.bin461]HIK02665.1 PIN domain-containing protein [Candidatus Naiadarchaeales archaeon SRR2090159.bin1288]
MNNKYVIDTSAWIEFLSGTKRGKTAGQFIQSGLAATPVIVIAELSDKYAREGWQAFEEAVNYVNYFTEVFPLTLGISAISGIVKKEMRVEEKNFSLADGIILATARTMNAKVVTGAREFSNAKDAIMI